MVCVRVTEKVFKTSMNILRVSGSGGGDVRTEKRVGLQRDREII